LACSSDEEPEAPALQVVGDDPSDAPIAGLDPRWQSRFDAGDAVFEAVFREPQGLGPTYVRRSCTGCHEGDARGPGMVRRVAERGGVLPFGTLLRPQAIAGATAVTFEGATVDRLGPPVFGRGYLEAIAEEAIDAQAEAQRGHPEVSGRVPRHRGVLGRFGLKAKRPTLEEFVALAYLDDMGLTSPLLPDEEGDDRKPGVDLSQDLVELAADYVRLLRIPPRRGDAEGERAFAEVGCAACHVPTMRTGRNEVPQLSEVDAPVYTDMLLHDMGEALADGIAERAASESEWRTAPLIGMRFARAYLHDGRAPTVDEAIRAHGGEAAATRGRYVGLDEQARAALLRFVEGL